MILDLLLAIKYYWFHAKTEQLKARKIEALRSTRARTAALRSKWDALGPKVAKATYPRQRQTKGTER